MLRWLDLDVQRKLIKSLEYGLLSRDCNKVSSGLSFTSTFVHRICLIHNGNFKALSSSRMRVIYLSIYYDFPIARMPSGNHTSRQPSASFRSAWVIELAWHVQWYCYVRVVEAEAVKPQLPWIFFIISLRPLARSLHYYLPPTPGQITPLVPWFLLNKCVQL